jgi:hypothetical protein
MFCDNCGIKCNQDDGFCDNCGADLITSEKNIANANGYSINLKKLLSITLKVVAISILIMLFAIPMIFHKQLIDNLPEPTIDLLAENEQYISKRIADYFRIPSLLERNLEKLLRYNGYSCTHPSKNIYVKDVKIKYNEERYRTPTGTIKTYEINDGYVYEYQHSYGGTEQHNIYGVNIAIELGNRGSIDVKGVQVKIKARTKKGGSSNQVSGFSYGDEAIKDSIVVDVPSSGVIVDKYYSTATRIRTQGLTSLLGAVISLFGTNQQTKDEWKYQGTYLKGLPKVKIINKDKIITQDDKYYMTASKENTIESYSDYLKKNSSCKYHISEAKSNLKKLYKEIHKNKIP